MFTRSGETWTQQGQKLRRHRGGRQRLLRGTSVALSADGNTALIGAPSDEDGVGAAWAFTRSGSSWTQQGAKITGHGELGQGFFGRSVALSGDGDTALIGGGYENTGANGAVWVLTRSGSEWTQQREQLRGSGEDDEEGSLGRLAGGGFGGSVALSADAGTALVGGGHGSDLLGAAWVFVDQAVAPSQPAEYGRCVPVSRVAGEHYRGRYGNADCTKPVNKGRYEWYGGLARTHFTSRIASGTAAFESVKRTRVTCSGETGTGEYSGAGLTAIGGVVLTFTGCEGLGQKCSSPQAAPGEIVSEGLAGALGIAEHSRSSARTTVGLDLLPSAGTGAFMQFNCGSTSVAIRGSLIGAAQSDRVGLTSKETFSASKGSQALRGFVDEPADVLEASFGGAAFEPIGLKLAMTVVNEEAMEVRSASHGPLHPSARTRRKGAGRTKT